MAEGRTTIQGTHAYVNEHVRRSYDYCFKRDVVRYYNCRRLTSGRPPPQLMAQTITRFFPDIRCDARESVRKMIHRWLKETTVIFERAATVRSGRVRRFRPSGVGTVLSRADEEVIVEWIVDLRRDGVPVSSLMLKLKALEVGAEAGLPEGAFVASKAWRSDFLKRHELSFRSRTHQGQISVEDAIAAADAFGVQVRAVMRALRITEVMNADQTALMFELLPKKTVSETGVKTVWVKCAGKDKDRATAMVTANSDGTKCTLFLVLKARPSSLPAVQAANVASRQGFGRDVWKEVRKLQEDHSIHIYGNRAGWWNAEIMVKYLETLFGERHVRSPPILLLLDHFSAHWTDEVKAYAASKNVVLMKIPAGLTWRAQPADVAWMKPLKDSLRRSWVESLRHQLSSRVQGERFKLEAPKRKTIVAWATTAWDSLSESTIKNGFIKCGYVFGQAQDDAAAPTMDAEDVLEELVAEGIVSYGAKGVLTDEMDVLQGRDARVDDEDGDESG